MLISFQDIINGSFELLGGVAILAHCFKVIKDKEVKGVSYPSVIFFTLWGTWNLYYYPHLNQWMSFLGGIAITLGNLWWCYLIWKYRKK